MEKCYVDRESVLLKEKQNQIDIMLILKDISAEQNRTKNYDESEMKRREERVKDLLKDHKVSFSLIIDGL